MPPPAAGASWDQTASTTGGDDDEQSGNSDDGAASNLSLIIEKLIRHATRNRVCFLNEAAVTAFSSCFDPAATRGHGCQG